MGCVHHGEERSRSNTSHHHIAATFLCLVLPTLLKTTLSTQQHYVEIFLQYDQQVGFAGLILTNLWKLDTILFGLHHAW